MLRRITLVLGLLLLLAVPVLAQDEAPIVTVSADGEVVVGLGAALSGEGLAPLGEDIQRGAELALEDRPTVTVGDKEFPVRLDAQDDQCAAEGGQAVASRFVADPSIVAIVGPMCSSACRAAAPVLDEAGYSSISPSCTAPDLTASDFTSFNRAVVSDAFQGRVAAEYIFNNLGLTRIATIHDGSPYGEGLVNVLTETFQELGGEVVAADAVNVGDTDFRGLLDDFAAEDPELVYFGGFAAEAARLAQQRADAGLEEVIFMGADGIVTDEFINLAGNAAEGVYASSAIPSGGNAEAVTAMLERYEEKYGFQPTGPYHTQAYDAFNMILDAVEAVGEVDDAGNLTVDRAALAEYIRSIQDFQGLSGVLNCDGTGECSAADIGIKQVQDGAFVDVAVGKPAEDGSITIEPVEEGG